jgi:hypothetical protein
LYNLLPAAFVFNGRKMLDTKKLAEYRQSSPANFNKNAVVSSRLFYEGNGNN